MAKSKKSTPKKVAEKTTVKHVQKNNDLVEDKQEQTGEEEVAEQELTEQQKVSNVLQNNKAT